MADLRYQIFDVLLFHIIPKLPIKYIHRFMCVCKQWQSILKTPMFANIYHRHHPPKKLLIVLSTKTPCTFQTIDCESPEDRLSTVIRPLPFSHENMSIIASVRGVVLVRIINKCNEKEYSNLILWNPLTGEYKTISRPPPNNEECLVTNATLLGLYFSCNDYKVLLVANFYFPDVYIYSLKSDSWRKVEMRQEDFEKFRLLGRIWTFKKPCVLLNEKLYFLIMQITSPISYSIIMFDLKTEKSRKIEGPFFGTFDTSIYVSFTVVNGCIHLYMIYVIATRIEIVLWRMDGDGDWTKVVTYNQPPFCSFSDMEALHLIKNGSWLMLSETSNLYKVDLEKQTKERMYASDNNKIIYAGGLYMETLGINFIV